MHDATVGGRADAFASPDLTAFCRLDELGLLSLIHISVKRSEAVTKAWVTSGA